ncbi:leucine-rich repeat domain-containing protein [Yersinia similis]|uniref:toxin n=1 Tax=Yersinia similis TaxID=367190 RepID=UPI0011A8B4AF|nr:toxin [Yersinia similis]
MKKLTYNENTGDLEIPLESLPEGLLYAKKKSIHNIKITKAQISLDYESAFSSLVGDDNIRSIYIADDVNLKRINLEPLYQLKNLKKLVMQYLKGRIDFSNISSLEALYITKADQEIDSLSIYGLEELLLVSIKNIDCKFISLLSELKILRISSARIDNLSGIEMLDKLEVIKLSHCPDLTDISSVGKLKELSELYVEKCKEINSFEFLNENNTINELFLSTVNSLSFIPTMKCIKYLKFWELKDGDLNYLLKSPSLEKVDFYPQKKHYTHKKEEINNLIVRSAKASAEGR